jgi:hypothetical protein
MARSFFSDVVGVGAAPRGPVSAGMAAGGESGDAAFVEGKEEGGLELAFSAPLERGERTDALAVELLPRYLPRGGLIRLGLFPADFVRSWFDRGRRLGGLTRPPTLRTDAYSRVGGLHTAILVVSSTPGGFFVRQRKMGATSQAYAVHAPFNTFWPKTRHENLRFLNFMKSSSPIAIWKQRRPEG